MFKLIIHGGISPHGSDRTEGEQLRSIFQYGEAPLEPRYWNGAVALSPQLTGDGDRCRTALLAITQIHPGNQVEQDKC